jgi:hypothetical protein
MLTGDSHLGTDFTSGTFEVKSVDVDNYDIILTATTTSGNSIKVWYKGVL